MWVNVSGNLRIVNGLQLIPDVWSLKGPSWIADSCAVAALENPRASVSLSLASTTVRVARSVARVASAHGLHVPSDPTGREGAANPLRISMTSHPALRFFH